MCVLGGGGGGGGGGLNDVGTGVVCRVCDFNNIELCSLILVP